MSNIQSYIRNETRDNSYNKNTILVKFFYLSHLVHKIEDLKKKIQYFPVFKMQKKIKYFHKWMKNMEKISYSNGVIFPTYFMGTPFYYIYYTNLALITLLWRLKQPFMKL